MHRLRLFRFAISLAVVLPFLTATGLIPTRADSAIAEASTSNPLAGVDLAATCSLGEYAGYDTMVLSCLVRVTNLADRILETRVSYLILDDGNGAAIAHDDALLTLTAKEDAQFTTGPVLQTGDLLEGYRAFLMPEDLPDTLRLTFANRAGGPTTDENRTLVSFPIGSFAFTPLQQTKVALEQELADARTKAAPTNTSTVTPVPTNTPTPETRGDEQTIAALKTEIASIEQGTPPATDTPTPEPTETATPRPVNTFAPTATATSDALPESLQGYADEDSKIECDHIGWNAASSDLAVPDDFIDEYPHYAGCSGDLEFVASCVIAPNDWVGDEPPLGDIWISCNLVVLSTGTVQVKIDPYDFTLIDARGVLQKTSPAEYGSIIDQEAFLGGPIEPGDYMQGFVLFSVSENQTSGLVLRLNEPEAMRSDTQPVIILLEPLPDASDM